MAELPNNGLSGDARHGATAASDGGSSRSVQLPKGEKPLPNPIQGAVLPTFKRSNTQSPPLAPRQTQPARSSPLGHDGQRKNNSPANKARVNNHPHHTGRRRPSHSKASAKKRRFLQEHSSVPPSVHPSVHRGRPSSVAKTLRTSPPQPALISDIHERRQQKHWRIRNQRLQVMAKLGACLVLTGVMVWLVQHVVLTGPLQQSPGIEVVNSDGLLLTPPAAIRDELLLAARQDIKANKANKPNKGNKSVDRISDVERLRHWWLTKPNDVEKRLESRLPFVQRATVSRRLLPNRWAVGIEEIRPWAIMVTPPAKPAKANGRPKSSPIEAPPTLVGAMVTGEDGLPRLIDGRRLSGEEELALLRYLRQPAMPLTTVWISQKRLLALTNADWDEVATLADWLRAIPDWPNPIIDLRFAGNTIIRPLTGPAVQLGPLNRPWPIRFSRVGPLLPYWPQWTGQVSSVDLRWPTQMILHPDVSKKSLSSKAQQVWQASLAKTPLPNPPPPPAISMADN